MRQRTVKTDDEFQGESPKVLLVGYNGANNTGAEAKLLAIIDDVRAVLGPEALITIPTLNEANLRRYIKEGPNLRVAPIPSVYFLAFRQLVKEHDLIILTEGSTYMDTWTSALLWAYLWVTRCAYAMGKPCLAYAVDSGSLSSFNLRQVRREASKTDLIITRNRAAADNLISWGVTAPIEVTADNAFTFLPDPADKNLLRNAWPEASSGIVGLAMVDFYRWPVVVRPWGRKENRYRWPYYFSHSAERDRAADDLATGFAKLADRLIEDSGKSVAMFCMEELDEPFARRVQQRMRNLNATRVFSARDYNASQMTVMLRGLDLLVTSRYHASVLSLAGRVPQVAVGHDLRLQNIYGDLGIRDDYFIDHSSPDLFQALNERVDSLLANCAGMKEILSRGYREHLARSRRNRELLSAFVGAHARSGAESRTSDTSPIMEVAA